MYLQYFVNQCLYDISFNVLECNCGAVTLLKADFKVPSLKRNGMVLLFIIEIVMDYANLSISALFFHAPPEFWNQGLVPFMSKNWKWLTSPKRAFHFLLLHKFFSVNSTLKV